jgi:transmembrane sensor
MSVEQDEATAADWLAREDRGLTAEEQGALDAWLSQSSLNRVAYLRLKAVWQRADRLAALKSPLPTHPPARIWNRPVAAAAIAASLVLLAGAGWFFIQHNSPVGQDYATGIGERQAVRLADGSQIELNTNTRLHAEVTKMGRIITLETGEAYFDVVHDAGRPFTVNAGNRRITDLGTKFSVFRKDDDVRVVVKEGRVRVEQIGQPLASPLVAEAGREVISKGSETLLTSKPDHEISNELSWRDGVLVFNQQTLAEVAEQFNRYNRRHIEVAGSARDIRIGGSFKADNVDVFVTLLHRGFGLSVNQQDDRILVSR